MIEGLAGSLLGWLPMLAAMLVVWGGPAAPTPARPPDPVRP